MKEVRALARMQLDRRGELAKMHGEQTRMIATLSAKLRLTPQARYQPATAGRKLLIEISNRKSFLGKMTTMSD